MDSPTAKKCHAIEAELDNILPLYSDVEKCLPYKDMHGDQVNDDNTARLNRSQFLTSNAPEQAIR